MRSDKSGGGRSRAEVVGEVAEAGAGGLVGSEGSGMRE